MRTNLKRYGLYLVRWQLSTPLLAVVLIWLSYMNKWIVTIIANLIGGLIFFWVDRFIFTSKSLSAQWEIKENVSCKDCGKIARGYRLVRTKNYDRTKSIPEYRCEECSKRKSEELKKKGVRID